MATAHKQFFREIIVRLRPLPHSALEFQKIS